MEQKTEAGDGTIKLTKKQKELMRETMKRQEDTSSTKMEKFLTTLAIGIILTFVVLYGLHGAEVVKIGDKICTFGLGDNYHPELCWRWRNTRISDIWSNDG